MSLTNTQCINAKPKNKPYKAADGHGLYLFIQPNGAKYWRFSYRFNSKQKTLALGVYPATSIKMARVERDKAKALMAQGVDPSEDRRDQKAGRMENSAQSFQFVANDWFDRKMAQKSDSHRVRTHRILEKDLYPYIGHIAIASVTPQILLKALRRIEGRGAIDTAHKAKHVSNQIFRYALASGLVERDPAADLTGALQTPTRTHLSAITEPKEFGGLLLAIDGFMGTPTVYHALKLAPLVFARPTELRHMEWSELNLEQARWVIPAEKMKMKVEHIVPLSTQAIEIIKEQEPYSVGTRYVFPSARGKSRAMSENAVRVALRTLGFTNEQMTGHGFRASARTMLDEVLHYRVEVIEMQLAHAVKDTLGRAYNRTQYMDQRTEMMQAWADYLDALRIEA